MALYRLAGGVFVLATLACAQDWKPSTLPDDFRILDVPSYENTVEVAPPSPELPQGSVVLATGSYARGTKLLQRPLIDSAGAIDRQSSTHEVDWPVGDIMAVATDNMLVRLADGSFLAQKDTFVWKEISPPPPWADELVTGRYGRKKFQRGSPVFFRSKDAGKTWDVASILDLSVLCDGRYGVPRPMTDKGRADVPVAEQGRDAEGNRYWWVGGADRTEVYACPFTGIIYCTTRIISGPYEDLLPRYNQNLLFRSVDNGQSWEPVREDLPGWSPLVMTSTPDGRLFLMQCVGSSNLIWCSEEPASKAEPMKIVGGHAVFYVENGSSYEAKGDGGVDMELKLAAPTIARIGADSSGSTVRVAYQSLNEHGRQVACVIDVTVKDPHAAPELRNVALLAAADPSTASAMYFDFVEPGADAHDSVEFGLHLLYWIDAPAKGAAERRYAARYALFDRGGLVGEPGYLSVSEGKPRTWSKRQDPGDYLDGAFFMLGGKPQFFCAWSEPDGLKANVVSVDRR